MKPGMRIERVGRSMGLHPAPRRSPTAPVRPTARFFRILEVELVEHLQFFQAFIREPASVGALSPSSRALARAMIQGFALDSAKTVVELGPGTGSFTGLIRERLEQKSTFITMELDGSQARLLQRRFPDLVVYNDSAEKLGEYLALHGKEKADYIVSGLPWANLPVPEQTRILNAIVESLANRGTFTTFAYSHARWLPKARQFRRNLEERFREVKTSPVIWRNLPPAFVYRCSHPR
jgi:phosphatidylethanolamine/phosphatidyl-N-methylethanolamine N-methyltransferase